MTGAAGWPHPARLIFDGA